MSFKKNKYQVIRGAISKELADVAYRYLQVSAEADNWMINNYVTHAGNPLVGNFHDPQVPNSYAKYADRFMETLLIDEYKDIHKPGAPIGVEVNLKPGDMLIYSGCELEHWRKPFEGKLCGQVFLHYNHADGRFAKANLYDKRPMLGIPKTR